MCYVAVSKYHTCFIMQKLIPQLSKVETNKFMPCKIYLQVWILEFVGPLAPPAPHRLPRKELFLGNLSVIMKFRIRHFM